MREMAKMNAMRSGIVVVGAIAFGYLTLQLGFKPFLEKAQYAIDKSEPSPDQHEVHDYIDNAQRLPEAFSDSDS